MKIHWLAIVLLFPMPGSASPGVVATLREAERKLVQTVSLPVPAGAKVRSILYGNSRYGYFETDRIIVRGQSVSFEMVPPGYRFPIETWLRGERLTKGRTLRPVSPFPDGYDRVGELKGREFSSPFTLLVGKIRNGVQVPREPRRFRKLFVYAVNRFGEPVWLYLPKKDFDSIELGLLAKTSGPGRYHILRYASSPRTAVYENVNSRGELLESSSFNGVTFHHDFQVIPNERLLVFTQTFRSFRRPWDFLGPKFSFLGSELSLLDRRTGSVSRVWDPLSELNPFRDPHWNRSVSYSNDAHPLNPDRSDWWDIHHANSLESVEGKGFLVSLRNQSRVLLLDPTLGKVIWSVGPGPDNTFRTDGTDAEFRMQHHVTLLPNGNLQLFDIGGLGGSQILEVALDRSLGRARLVKRYVPDPPVWAVSRGSAFPLPNGNVLGLFYSGVEDPRFSEVIEFDGRTAKEVARLTIPFEITYAQRAEPLSSIGNERYLGKERPLDSASLAIPPLAGESVNRQ